MRNKVIWNAIFFLLVTTTSNVALARSTPSRAVADAVSITQKVREIVKEIEQVTEADSASEIRRTKNKRAGSKLSEKIRELDRAISAYERPKHPPVPQWPSSRDEFVYGRDAVKARFENSLRQWRSYSIELRNHRQKLAQISRELKATSRALRVFRDETARLYSNAVLAAPFRDFWGFAALETDRLIYDINLTRSLTRLKKENNDPFEEYTREMESWIVGAIANIPSVEQVRAEQYWKRWYNSAGKKALSGEIDSGPEPSIRAEDPFHGIEVDNPGEARDTAGERGGTGAGASEEGLFGSDGFTGGGVNEMTIDFDDLTLDSGAGASETGGSSNDQDRY